jgi:hypothetical protein
MQLDFIHLAAYLPYSLKVFSGDSKEVYTLIGVENNYGKIHYSRTIQIHGEDRLRRYQQNIKYCKPILKRLEFLSSEFSLYASKIMTIHEENHKTTSKQVIQHQLLSLVNANLSIDYRMSKTHKWIVDLLLKWHFDIFGLIDKELAVDANTL